MKKLFSFAIAASAAAAALAGTVVTNDTWLGYSRTIYDVGGTRCWVVAPESPRADKAWVWCTEWPDAFTDRTGTKDFLKNGFHFLHAEVGTMSLGGPKCQKDMDAFYDFFTGELGLAKKGCLTGVSRGGLYAFIFANRHPDRVTCLYGDHPVMDFKSWPLHLDNVGKWYDNAFADIKRVYGFTNDMQVLAYRGNPVETEFLRPIAEAKIPVLFVIGEADTDVPPEYNANVVESRYRKLGGRVKSLRFPKYAHHPHGADDPMDIVAFVSAYVDAPTVLTAHRGGRAEFEDNAVYGFVECYKAGVRSFETDIQYTKDGGLVVMHDDTIDRTANGSGIVTNMTVAELTAVTLKKSGEPIPTAERLFDAMSGFRDVRIELEMKVRNMPDAQCADYCGKLYALAKEKLPAGSYTFTSFDEKVLKTMKTRHPDAETGYITVRGLGGDEASELIAKAKSLGCSAIAVGEAGSTAAGVAEAKRAGLYTIGWMCQDEETYIRGREKGFQAMTSDFPVRLSHAFCR